MFSVITPLPYKVRIFIVIWPTSLVPSHLRVFFVGFVWILQPFPWTQAWSTLWILGGVVHRGFPSVYILTHYSKRGVRGRLFNWFNLCVNVIGSHLCTEHLSKFSWFLFFSFFELEIPTSADEFWNVFESEGALSKLPGCWMFYSVFLLLLMVEKSA